MLPFDTNIFPFKTGVFIVGGSIRDLIAGRTPHDYDLAVHQDSGHFASRLAATTGGHIVELGQQAQKMLRVVTSDRFFDIMPVNGASIEQDLRLRDFTINAMAFDVSSGKLLDPLGGQKDLKAKMVRMVSREVFGQDPVRLVRAYRMAATFGFSISKDTLNAIAADANLIQKTAGERIREELFKILQCPDSHSYLSMMAGNELLSSIFPEFLYLRRLRAYPAAPRTLLDQTLDAYDHLEKILTPENEFKRSIDIRPPGADDARRSILLKWAILFHNLEQGPDKSLRGKREFQDPGGSSAITRSICHRLRFSRRQSDTIETIVRHHAKPLRLFLDHQKNIPIKKEFIRLFLNCNEITPDVLLHALAEFRGQRNADDPVLNEFTDFIRILIQKYEAVLRPRAARPAPINGNDLINEFGMKPSAEFRRILNQVEEERLGQPTYSRKEALKLVQNLINQKS
jgi:tRNA nucleotidyltransferase/poly(A) polymerase